MVIRPYEHYVDFASVKIRIDKRDEYNVSMRYWDIIRDWEKSSKGYSILLSLRHDTPVGVEYNIEHNQVIIMDYSNILTDHLGDRRNN